MRDRAAIPIEGAKVPNGSVVVTAGLGTAVFVNCTYISCEGNDVGEKFTSESAIVVDTAPDGNS